MKVTSRLWRQTVRLSKEPALLSSIIVIFALLAVFIVYPIVMVAVRSFSSTDAPGLGVYSKLM